MAINTSSVTGSSIDTASIVQQLMQIESRPLTKLQQKEAAYLSKITAMGSLLGSVSGLKSSVTALKDTAILGYKATVSDATMFSASTTSSASAGSHTIQVKQLASTQSIYSGTFVAESTAVADLSGAPSQKLQIQVGSTIKEITVDSTNNTLAGIRDAINTADAGARASIVNDGTGYRLVLNSTTTGSTNRIKISVAEDGTSYSGTGVDIDNTIGLSRLAFDPTYNADGTTLGGVRNLTQSQAALDAVFRVDGLEITKSSNTISDVLTGVAFTLAKADNYASTATLTIDKDTSSLKAKVSAFVNAYNSLNTQIKALRGNVNSKGALSGEPVLLSLGNAVRGITSATFADNQLSNLGISLDKSGVMSLDSAKLDAAISADSSAVVATLNAMGASVETNLNAYVTDVLPSRQKGLQETVKTIQKSEELMQNRLLQIQSRLQKQYSKLDTLLQQLQGTSDYVTQAMTQITNQFKKT